ncbi:hypothetical protein OROMI_006960 [Orobanche minor]
MGQVHPNRLHLIFQAAGGKGDANCLKKVEACADEYKCCSCNKKTLSPTLRYRLKVEIRVNTLSLIAMMRDELCHKLFSKSAAELGDRQGKEYLFKVSGYQGSGGGRVYNISGLCSDPNIINLHKSAHHDSSFEQSDSDDDLYRVMSNTKKQDYDMHVQLTEEQIKNYALVEIEKILRQRGKSLHDYESMPSSDITYFVALNILLISDKLNYDTIALAEEHDRLVSNMTDEQRGVYSTIMTDVDGNHGGVFFLYGHGGTGKIFLWRTLSTAIRSRGKIVLNVASSAIATTLLPGGRMAHSKFVILLNPEKDSSCNINQGSHLAELIEKTRLVIWDEAPMVNKFFF